MWRRSAFGWRWRSRFVRFGWEQRLHETRAPPGAGRICWSNKNHKWQQGRSQRRGTGKVESQISDSHDVQGGGEGKYKNYKDRQPPSPCLFERGQQTKYDQEDNGQRNAYPIIWKWKFGRDRVAKNLRHRTKHNKIQNVMQSFQIRQNIGKKRWVRAYARRLFEKQKYISVHWDHKQDPNRQRRGNPSQKSNDFRHSTQAH